MNGIFFKLRVFHDDLVSYASGSLFLFFFFLGFVVFLEVADASSTNFFFFEWRRCLLSGVKELFLLILMQLVQQEKRKTGDIKRWKEAWHSAAVGEIWTLVWQQEVSIKGLREKQRWVQFDGVHSPWKMCAFPFLDSLKRLKGLLMCVVQTHKVGQAFFFFLFH